MMFTQMIHFKVRLDFLFLCAKTLLHFDDFESSKFLLHIVDAIISQINPPGAMTQIFKSIIDEINFEWFKKANIKEILPPRLLYFQSRKRLFFIVKPLKMNLVLLNIIQKRSFLKTGKIMHFQKKITI